LLLTNVKAEVAEKSVCSLKGLTSIWRCNVGSVFVAMAVLCAL
jgi:hypothetical protein